MKDYLQLDEGYWIDETAIEEFMKLIATKTTRAYNCIITNWEADFRNIVRKGDFKAFRDISVMYFYNMDYILVLMNLNQVH